VDKIHIISLNVGTGQRSHYKDIISINTVKLSGEQGWQEWEMRYCSERTISYMRYSIDL